MEAELAGERLGARASSGSPGTSFGGSSPTATSMTLLAPDAVTYDDLAAAASDDGGSGPSLLKGIFREAVGGDAILAAWLVDDGRDAEIAEKGAERELLRLVRSRLGMRPRRRRDAGEGTGRRPAVRPGRRVPVAT